MLYRSDLERIVAKGCATPGCTHKDHDTLFLHSTCHPEAGHRISYRANSGLLRVACRRCGKAVADVAVAERSDPA